MEVSWESWACNISNGVLGVGDAPLRAAAGLLSNARLVVTAGNGGSHALATHAAQALLKPDFAAGGGVPAFCISDGIPALTAHANDGGWASALRELATPFLGIEGLALLLFSSSGQSSNLVQLAKAARDAGRNIVAFTGFKGEPLRSIATLSIHVDASDYEVVEPVHDALLHRMQYHLRQLRGCP